MHALFLLASLPALHAPPVALPNTTPQAQEDSELILFYSAGLDAILVDGKDAGLRAAMHLVDERLAELPAELGSDFPFPPEAPGLIERLLTGPIALRVGKGKEGGLPIYAQLELPGDESASKELSQNVRRMLSGLGMPRVEPDARGLTPIEVPVPAWYGAIPGAFVVSVGEVVEGPLDFGDTGLPPGVLPTMYARGNVGAMLELAADFGLTAGPDMEPMLELLEVMGLAHVDLRWSMGNDAERGYSVFRLPGSAPDMRAAGLIAAQPISRAALAAVPADAGWASLGANNLEGTLKLILRMIEEPLGDLNFGEDPLTDLEAEIGIHLKRDLLDHLGSTLGVYTSDSTGGGGWLSMVAFAELGQVEPMEATVARIETMVDELGESEADGYVRIRHWESGGQKYSSLIFPGLPVPFEPTWAIANNFFLLAVTPQGAQGAVRHLKSGGQGLLANPQFSAQLSGSPDELLNVTFFDTPRFLRSGYGITSLFCSGLINATRSRRELGREPGRILPSFAALSEGAKAYVTSTRVVGEDVVQEARYDRSFMVNGTATIGFLADSPLMLMIPAAALAGIASRDLMMATPEYEEMTSAIALEEARTAPAPQDPFAAAAEDILALHYAAAEFAVLNGGQYPESFEFLITRDENGYTFLGGTELPIDPWGNAYLYEQPPAGADMPRIYSLGADGVEGGEGYNRDLTNAMVLDRKRREAGGR